MHKLLPVRTMDFQRKVIESCVKRNDAWSETVKARVEFVQDLHAADAVYHNICSINFRTDVFKYELCSYPPALFQTTDILLEADKPALAEAIWKQLPLAVRNTVLPQNVLYVLDDGALLHRIPWNSGETYEGISSHYIRYVGDRYGNTVVVFDGYMSAPSTKDVAHSRHVRSHSSPLVNFT